MANDKKVFSASDAAPVVLYAKQDASQEQAYPIVADANGAVVIRNLTADINWDTIVPSFATLTDTYVFSESGSTTKTIVVTYTDASKETLAGVTKV